MSFERGNPHTYEIAWSSGHVEQISAHQVQTPKDRDDLWTFMAEIEGKWTLLLAVPAGDIRSVRNVDHTSDQPLPN